MSAASRISWPERKANVLAATDLKSLVESAGATVVKTTSEYKGSCPICGGGGFTLYEDATRWHCFSACDTGGNAIDFVVRYDQIEFVPAIEKLEARAGISAPTTWQPERVRAARAAADKRKIDDARGRLKRQANMLLYAAEIWDGARPLSPLDAAWRYLADRGLPMSDLMARLAPDTLRFHPGLGHPQERTGPGSFARLWPALVVRVTDLSGALRAVQTIWIDPTTQEAPSDIQAAIGRSRRIWRPVHLDPAKRATGSWQGAVCRLFAVEPGRPLALAEGIEKAMAYTALYGVPCWAVMFAANFQSLSPGLVDLPGETPSEIVYAVDINKPLVNKRTGKVIAPDGVSIQHAREGLAILRKAGRAARIVRPPAGSDWSDVLVAHLGQPAREAVN